jgi:hypothetical protein
MVLRLGAAAAAYNHRDGSCQEQTEKGADSRPSVPWGTIQQRVSGEYCFQAGFLYNPRETIRAKR